MLQALLPLLLLGLTLFALLDAAMTDESEVRLLPKPVWIIAIVLVPILGPKAWLVLGRPRPQDRADGGTGRRSPSGRAPMSRSGGARPGGPRSGAAPAGRNGGRRGPAGPPPKGPDDDPDFLKRLDEQLRRRDDG